MKEYEIKHLTKAGRRWVLHGTVPDDDAEKLDRAIALGLPHYGGNKSRLMRTAVENHALEPVYRERNALALDLIDSYGLLSTWTPDAQVIIENLRKALTGCPTDTNTVFTGRSEEYEERYGDEY